MKVLYLAKNIEELNTRARYSPPKIFYQVPKVQLKSAEKLLAEAKSNVNTDQEKAYICYMKSLDMIKCALKNPKIADLERDLYKKLPTAEHVFQLCQKLSESLQTRYAEAVDESPEKGRSDEILEGKTGSILKLKGNSDKKTIISSMIGGDHKASQRLNPKVKKYYKAKQMTVQELKTQMEQKAILLIIDCREDSDFQIAHVDHPNCISLPPDRLSQGHSADKIGKLLSTKSQPTYRDWISKRVKFEKVILYDLDSSFDRPSPNLQTAYAAVAKWNHQVNVKARTYIIQGGLRSIYSSFPMLVNKPKNIPFKKFNKAMGLSRQKDLRVLKQAEKKTSENHADMCSRLEKELRHRSTERVVLLIDIDCYEYQVWMKKKRPDLEGKDIPGVVINLDNIILAVNYSARKLGITRGKGPRALAEAKRRCPNLQIIIVDTKLDIVDTDYPLSESDKIVDVLREYKDTFDSESGPIIEVSSRDEYYVDVTNVVKSAMFSEHLKVNPECASVRSYAIPAKEELDKLTESDKELPHEMIIGDFVTKMESRKQLVSGKTLKYIIREIYGRDLEEYHLDEARLVFGAIIAQTLRERIEHRTGYHASVGVGHSKLIAKLACDRNKPQGITIIQDAAIPRLNKEIKFQDLPGFKGALGRKLREEYKRETGKQLITLQDVQRIGPDRLVGFLKKIKVSNPEVIDGLIKILYLRVEKPVTTRYYSDTLSLSIQFKGRNSINSWSNFKERLASASRIFVGRLSYRHNKHGILASQCSVNVGLKTKGGNVQGNTRAENVMLEMKELPEILEVYKFVLKYVESNKFDAFSILSISWKASKFK